MYIRGFFYSSEGNCRVTEYRNRPDRDRETRIVKSRARYTDTLESSRNFGVFSVRPRKRVSRAAIRRRELAVLFARRITCSFRGASRMSRVDCKFIRESRYSRSSSRLPNFISETGVSGVFGSFRECRECSGVPWVFGIKSRVDYITFGRGLHTRYARKTNFYIADGKMRTFLVRRVRADGDAGATAGESIYLSRIYLYNYLRISHLLFIWKQFDIATGIDGFPLRKFYVWILLKSRLSSIDDG